MLIALPNAIGNAATNMAVDASLLESIPEGTAIFRHYGWTEPAFTFGYAQAYKEVIQTIPGDFIYCRRLTGGGIVDHRNDWTYALVVHKTLPAYERAATELYKALHHALAKALEEQSVPSQPAPCPRTCSIEEAAPTEKMTGPSQCFVSPATDDVLALNGQKIAGAAMKRSRSGLLIQGSIDRSRLPESFDYFQFSQDFTRQLCQHLNFQPTEVDDLRTLFDGPRIQAFREQFTSAAWNQRR